MTKQAATKQGRTRAPQTESERAARHVLNFLVHDDTPDFIHSAVMDAINSALWMMRRHTFNFPSEALNRPTQEREEYESLERLFRLLPPTYDIPGHHTPERLARDLAAVLKNRQLPPALYEAVYSAMNSEFTPVVEEVDRSAEYIALCLEALARKGGDE